MTRRTERTTNEQVSLAEMAIGKAHEKIVDYVLNPGLDRLPEYTIIPRGSAMLLSIQHARHHLFDRKRHELDEEGQLIRYVSLAETALNMYYRLQRSSGGTLLKLAMETGQIELGGGDELDTAWMQ